LKLLWIRHGETEWNREFRLQGTSDIPLNDHGRRQAERVAEAVDEKPDRVYVSPLLRTREFAAPLARRYGLGLTELPDLREMSFGRWEGSAYAEMNDAERQALVEWGRAPHLSSPPGGESLADVAARVGSVLQLLESELGEEGTAAVITHGGVIRVLVTLVLKADLASAGRLQISPASLSVTEKAGTRHKLILMNDTCHLKK
jgi:broad specificity phosphatase PhoE